LTDNRLPDALMCFY